MAIEVRIPTILRSYTGGAKAVEGAGDTLADLLPIWTRKHTGLRGRLITDEGGLHRFVNVYVNDEDVRFLGALDAKLDRRRHRDDPARGRRRRVRLRRGRRDAARPRLS